MITAVVLTKNEEKNITDCIESLSFCDEILVIDDFSTDNTMDLAKKAGATVSQHGLEDNFAKQRNVALEKAKEEWVLFVDADERVGKDLQKEIIAKLSHNTDTQGYYIKRVDFMNGKLLQHGETAHVSLLRLAKKGKGTWKGMVHETWEISGKTEHMDAPLLHYPHPTIDDFLREINFYSDLRSKELFDKEVRVHWYDLIIYPKAKFIQNYFFRLGFKDGTEGMVMALMMSFHSFLVRGKLWQLWDGKKTK